MHYAKYGKNAVGSILMHSDRGIDAPDTHTHSNENIDSSRTHLNYDLKDRGGLSAYAYYKQRIEQIAAETKERTGKSIRKDAVTLCSWAVTLPKDLPENKQADFFKAAYEWFSERYGADNIVTAAVHQDETTPHMHLQFTPIIKKDGVRKLCAKDMETRRTLQTAHQELQKSLQQALGCEVNILNGATDKGNKSILELQNETLRQQVQQLEERAKKAEARADKATRKLEIANAQYDEANRALEKVLDQKARASEIKRGLFNRDVQSYHVSMLDSTRAIGTEAYKDNAAGLKARQEAVAIKVEAERKEQVIEPLYQQARAAHQQAEKDRQLAAALKKNQEMFIEERAKQLANERVREMFADVPSKREHRKDEFLDKLKFPDGRTALEAFEEQEKQLHKKLKRGLER